MQILSHKHSITFLLLTLLVATFLIYAPGTTGDFIFDDYGNIVNNSPALITDLSLSAISEAFFSGVATSLSRPLSMLTFALNNYFTGLDPFYFKLTNIFIHLLICPGLYLLSKELLLLGPRPIGGDERRIEWLALLITAVWALHPLNVSSVLYIVQRMNQLAALAGVYTLLYYCRFRRKSSCTNAQALRALVLIALFIAVGVLFKENAILVVLYILAIEIFLLDFSTSTPGHRLFVKVFTSVFILLPGVLLLIVLVVSPVSVIGNYAVRDFTLWERVLTETRVLWEYAGWILMPDTRDFVFYHDAIAVSHGLTDPGTTLTSALGLVVVSAFCYLYRRKLPFLCFGIAFFLAGHALESTIINLELVFEHRNYLPSFGLIFAGVYTLLHLPRAYLGEKPAAAFLLLFLAFLAQSTYAQAKIWSNTFTHLQSMVAGNPNSHRANYSLGHFYNRIAPTASDRTAMFDAASYYHRRAMELDPQAIRSHVGVLLADSQNNKPLDTVVVAQLETRLENLYLTHRIVNEFALLSDCLYRGYCDIDKATFARFLNAMARNKVSNPVVAQTALAQLGVAVATVFGRPEEGLAILYLARNIQPDLTLVDLQLIQLEMQLEDRAQARQLLLEARQKNGGSVALRDGLTELETELSSYSNL